MPNLNNPKAIAETGKAIYDEKYRCEYESRHDGQFVAVDVVGGSATLGKTASEAILTARSQFPNGIFHVIRVGHLGAFEVGMAYKDVASSRLHR